MKFWRPWRSCAGVLVLTLPGLSGAPALADGLLDETPNTASDTLTTVFPNWARAPAAFFDLTICDDVTCPFCTAGDIQSVTLFNYGSASGGAGGDISGVYFNLFCGKTNAWGTLTYAGVWTVGASNYPAWTWVGPIAWAADPGSACAGDALLSTYVDIGSCPVEGRTVTMGLGLNDIVNPGQPGGVWDTCGYQVPNWGGALRTGNTKYIRYVLKSADRVIVPPGDTVTYTIYYGAPGGPGISNIVVMDTLPAYTHYVAGSAVPAPDAFWDPDPGPPLRMRWTLPGVASTSGGATGSLTYKVTVDWGNGEAFEPGSGDAGAPEGVRLANVAAVEFVGSGCNGPFVNPPTDTVVRRYMIWKLADQDVLFASRVGMPDDEITYSIFLTNMSTSRTWWNLDVWDTVPVQLETWDPGFGFWDNCAAQWTMTPTLGCAPGAPGGLVNASGTIMTWRLGDFPPGATMRLDWKAHVKAAGVPAGSTAQGYVSVMARGRSAVVGGSGHAQAARGFYHSALIVLRTTYFSYVGQAADSGCAGLAINLFPLNKAANFELRKLENYGAGFATSGGKSASINVFQGTCLGGFVDGGYGGCGPERAPAQYYWLDSCASTPNAVLYKLTSNVPILWMLMPEIGGGGDAFTFIPSTTLSFSGWTLYSYRRSVSGEVKAGWGESWVVFNTSVGPSGVYDPALTTTVHLFRWDPAALQYTYLKSADIDKNSLYMPWAGCPLGDDGQYKIISSDARLTVYQGYGTFGDPNITFAYNDHGGNAPTAEGGTFVSKPGAAGSFYTLANNDPGACNFEVGNNSAGVKATFRLYRYMPRDPSLAVTGIPATLCGTSGTWQLLALRSVDAGMAAVTGPTANAFVGGAAGTYDTVTTGLGSTANAWKVEWVGGGNLSVYSGSSVWSNWAGGNMMHAADGNATGTEFWLHHATGQSPGSWAFILFCPVTGMAVNAVSSDGWSATYTTDGPDQAVMFTDLSSVAYGDRRNYVFRLLAGGAQGEMMGQRHQIQYREKFYTAPFVATGVHYDIIAPPVVFSGQPFWITVVVVLGTGTTKIDYCGTTSFSATDPTARIAGIPMDSYNFTWSSSTACTSAPDENGIKLFMNVSLSVLGDQTIVAGDTMDGSITGIGTTYVVGVDVKIEKQPKFQIAASGDTVRFRICWSNYSSASAFTFTLTDAVPVGTAFVPEAAATGLDCGNTDGVTPIPSYSTLSTATVPAAASFVSANPVAGTRWLRWTLPQVGVQTTGCVCYRVVIQ
ncbi:MAG: DUF11 domain-containing protein [Candidatus Coatesbacteria bacterium]